MGTGIEWTNETWNPTTGCDRISTGCDHCYALTMAKRLKAMGQAKYQTDGDPRTSGPGFGVAIHHDTLMDPFHWRKPRKVFVDSMSDLFHARIPAPFIAKVFAVMMATPQHTYQVLTKRSLRMRRVLNSEAFYEHLWAEFDALGSSAYFSWPVRNVWLGISAENEEEAHRREPDLIGTPASVRFISAEPLLGLIDFEFDHECGDPPHWTCPVPDWLIIGGESGATARPMDLAWARSIIRQCREAGVAVFVKQLGEHWARHDGPVWGDRHGGDPDAWPEDLRIREFPRTAEAVPA